MIYTNNDKYDLSIAVWLASDDYDHQQFDKPYLSATELLQPTRMMVLKQRARIQPAAKQNAVDISQFIPSRLGTAIHSGVEVAWTKSTAGVKYTLKLLGYPKSVIDRIVVNPTEEELQPNSLPVYLEQRAYREINGYIIGGKFDFVGNGTLEDVKTMGVWGFIKGDKDDNYIKQGSIYRWLNPDKITNDYMRIQQIFTDWSKLDATKFVNKGYPQSRIVSKQLKLMPIEETERWVRKRIVEVKQCTDTPEPELPLCSMEDLWQSDPQYKYYSKPDAKRATRVFDSAGAAYAYMADKCKGKGRVEEIPATVKRCAYCGGYDLCTQKDTYLEAGMLQIV